MNHSAGYLKNSDQRWMSPDSDDESLPRESEGSFMEQPLGSIKKLAKETSIQTSKYTPEEGNKAQNRDQGDINTFWISVSGYEYAKAYTVYRFFCDIGHIVGNCSTETNLMYLKYFSLLDCQIALSYNGQKIGYGGDIKVKVKPENPVTESAVIEALERCSNDKVNPTGSNSTNLDASTDVGENRDQNIPISKPHHLEIGKAKDFENIQKRVGIKQWIKEKLSYMFYFY